MSMVSVVQTLMTGILIFIKTDMNPSAGWILSENISTPALSADVYTRETEVWFIDAGPYTGTAYDYVGDGNFTWSDQGRFEQYPGELLPAMTSTIVIMMLWPTLTARLPMKVLPQWII
jgi:hypothetical protein